MRRLKLKTRHIEWLAEFVESRGIRGFTLAEAWHHLQHEFPTLGWISQSTVDRIQNQKLWLSYKKLGGTNIKKTRPDSNASLVSWTETIIRLLQEKFYLIYVDEFTINRKTTRTYGWTKKGSSGRLLIRQPEFKMSFVIAHSHTKVEGIMGTKTTFNQHKYKFILKEVINRLKREVQYQSLERVVIVANNWVFHRAKLIKSYITKEKLRWFFIPPYSPEINAWEKLINLLKSRVNALAKEQRQVFTPYI